MQKVLTIAGSDCSGGAGIQADLKTMTVHHVYGMSVITALTAQNTLGVQAISEIPPAFVAQQMDSIFSDIRPDAVKIGMVASSEIIEVIADKLIEYNMDKIVIDPVMISSSGRRLLAGQALETLVTKLLPLGTLITPNIPEAEVLCGFPIQDECEIPAAAAKIGKTLPSAILIKGGHLSGEAADLLYENHTCTWLRCKRIDNPNTHGTGCTLSTAIACNLAKGMSLTDSVTHAKEYLTGALRAGLSLGKGAGPLNHMFSL